MTRYYQFLLLLACLTFTESTKVLTGIDCEARDKVAPPFYRVIYGHGDERDFDGRIFQFEKCDGNGCWDTDNDHTDDWLVCGYSYQLVQEMDEMLDAKIIADAKASSNSCKFERTDIISGQANDFEGGMGGWNCLNGGNCVAHEDFAGRTSVADVHECTGMMGSMEQTFSTEAGRIYELNFEAYASEGKHFQISFSYSDQSRSDEVVQFSIAQRSWSSLSHVFTSHQEVTITIEAGADHCIHVDDITLSVCTKEYPRVSIIDVNQPKATTSELGEYCPEGMKLVSLQDADHLEFLKKELLNQKGESYAIQSKGIALGYGYQSDHIFYDLNDPTRPLTEIFHNAYLREIITRNQADENHGEQTTWVGFGWGSISEIHDYDGSTNEHSAVFCEHEPIGAGIWHTVDVAAMTIDADCPNKQCVDVDSLATCKRLCEEDEECKVVNFRKYGGYRCCLREITCDYSTAMFHEHWDILERSNTMPKVVTDVITRVWQLGTTMEEGKECGEENPGFQMVAYWDATDGHSRDITGFAGEQYFVLCARYGEWNQARSTSFVSDLFVSKTKQNDAIWIGSTGVKGKRLDEHHQAWGYRDQETIPEDMHFHIAKQYGIGFSKGGENSPHVRYIPGIPVGGWAILYSGNGAGDSHTFTSILTSTDETSSHEEKAKAFSSSSSWEVGASLTYESSAEVAFKGIFSAKKEFSISAHWSHSQETSEEISNTVANTLTSSLENGQEVSCTFTAPDIGGAPYNTWVWKTARQTYDGQVTELQTCHTHVKVGPCRDQPPNCIPGYCKDQDCQECLDESAKIDSNFSLRDECTDENHLLDCHASNFDSSKWTCCTPEDPCGMDEGDCDTDADCKDDLVCVQDAGAGYGVSQYVDVCMTSRKDNGRRRRLLDNTNEHSVDYVSNGLDDELTISGVHKM